MPGWEENEAVTKILKPRATAAPSFSQLPALCCRDMCGAVSNGRSYRERCCSGWSSIKKYRVQTLWRVCDYESTERRFLTLWRFAGVTTVNL